MAMLYKTSTLRLRTWWASHSTALLRFAVALMAVVASIWLGYEFWRLLLGSEPVWPSSPTGAVDLRLRYEEVHRWFAGMFTYGELKGVVYPPASYVILWPLLGWLDFTPARWLWAVTAVIMLVWLIYLIVRESGADTTLDRLFVALIPLSMYATGATIGNGQLIVHILPPLIAGLLLANRGQCGWRNDLLVTALVLAALVKPSISAPFFWILVFIPGGLRPALLVCLGYVALTLFALSFQNFTLFFQGAELSPLSKSTLSATWAASVRYADLPVWLATLGLKEWVLPASLLVLAVLGFWIYRHRHGDIWLLLGVTALVSRFWAYHRWYDDLLVLLPMVALFRIARRGLYNDGSEVLAGVLLAITLLLGLAPGGLYVLPQPWVVLYGVGQAIVWIFVLIFLLDRAWRGKKRESHLINSLHSYKADFKS